MDNGCVKALNTLLPPKICENEICEVLIEMTRGRGLDLIVACISFSRLYRVYIICFNGDEICEC